jgi:hypothetical protein
MCAATLDAQNSNRMLHSGICQSARSNRSLLFQQGRFRRLRSYLRLRATECIAETAEGEPRHWFNRHLPQKLTLGDPGLRDAALWLLES